MYLDCNRNASGGNPIRENTTNMARKPAQNNRHADIQYVVSPNSGRGFHIEMRSEFASQYATDRLGPEFYTVAALPADQVKSTALLPHIPHGEYSESPRRRRPRGLTHQENFALMSTSSQNARRLAVRKEH